MAEFPNPFGMTAWLVHSFGKFAIAAWYGSIASIPEGWFLCDGNNGTPDLRDKFIVGAGGAYNPDDSSDVFNHNHSLTTDGHIHGIEGTPGELDYIAGQGNIGVPSETDTGTTSTDSHRTPFKSLAYIMESK